MTTSTKHQTPANRTAQNFPQGPSALGAVSLALLFIGARLLDEQAQIAALLTGTLAQVAAAAWRVVGLPATGGARLLRMSAGAAHVVVGAGGLLSILLCGLPELPDDAVAIAASLALLSVTGGSIVLAAFELLMAQSRASGFVDEARVQRATSTAVTLVAGVGMLVGVVYGVHKQDVSFDLAYAAPTSPSGATLALVDTAVCGDTKEKPEVFLFFERGSTALSEVQDYFEILGQKGVRLQTLDQAMDPALAKAIKVTKNGYVGFRCGAKTETWLVGAERDDAQKKLQKLDEEVRTRLGKISRDPVNVYMTVGHGERAVEESDNSGRLACKKLKKLLESQNVKPKRLGVADGLTAKVPNDAGLVVVLGPQRPFQPEEARTLVEYVEGGGALALFLDPPVPGSVDVDALAVGASLQPVLDALALQLGGSEVNNETEFLKQSGTKADFAFLFSTSFGSHKSVKTLNSARGKAALLFLQAQSVSRTQETRRPRRTKTSRSRWSRAPAPPAGPTSTATAPSTRGQKRRTSSISSPWWKRRSATTKKHGCWWWATLTLWPTGFCPTKPTPSSPTRPFCGCCATTCVRVAKPLALSRSTTTFPFATRATKTRVGFTARCSGGLARCSRWAFCPCGCDAARRRPRQST